MADHPIDKILMKDSYAQGALWCLMSLNFFTLIVFYLDFKVVNFLISFGLIVIFMIRGQDFIHELRKSNFFNKRFLKFIVLDSFITFLSGSIFPIFFILKIFTFLWFAIMVSEHWGEIRDK